MAVKTLAIGASLRSQDLTTVTILTIQLFDRALSCWEGPLHFLSIPMSYRFQIRFSPIKVQCIHNLPSSDHFRDEGDSHF